MKTKILGSRTVREEIKRGGFLIALLNDYGNLDEGEWQERHFPATEVPQWAKVASVRIFLGRHDDRGIKRTAREIAEKFKTATEGQAKCPKIGHGKPDRARREKPGCIIRHPVRSPWRLALK
jgi:hypothetical protein